MRFLQSLKNNFQVIDNKQKKEYLRGVIMCEAMSAASIIRGATSDCKKYRRSLCKFDQKYAWLFNLM